ncbi:MAG: cupredoxin domain-containing protein [bacterium]|nr:cupredoxin domain-containing protein [bacterium]
MNTRTSLLVAVFALGATTVAGAAAPKTVEISAKDFAFTPAVVTLKAGQPVTLKLVATQGAHGLQAPEIGLDKVVTITSKPTEVTVTPKKAGTFVEHCALFCGAGHANMAITFKVVK